MVPVLAGAWGGGAQAGGGVGGRCPCWRGRGAAPRLGWDGGAVADLGVSVGEAAQWDRREVGAYRPHSLCLPSSLPVSAGVRGPLSGRDGSDSSPLPDPRTLTQESLPSPATLPKAGFRGLLPFLLPPSVPPFPL